MNRISRAIFILLATAPLLVGCQEGRKKDVGEVAVYQDGVGQCNQISTELLIYEVNLDGASNPSTTGDTVLISTQAAKAPNDLKVRSLLERYITLAEKLLTLGDTKVVVFPEKEQISTRLNHARQYLGDLYSQKDWYQRETAGAFANAEVDRAEYLVRSGRYMKLMNALIKLGFKSDSVEDFKMHATAARALATARLLPLSAPIVSASLDVRRSRDLAVRNDHWQDNGVELIAKVADVMNAYFWSVQFAVKDELKKRSVVAK